MHSGDGHPLPLIPAAYGISGQSFARPCVAATLPPARLSEPTIETVPPVEIGFAPSIDPVADKTIDAPLHEPPSHVAATPVAIVEEIPRAVVVEQPFAEAAPSHDTFNISAMADPRSNMRLEIDPVGRPEIYGAPLPARRLPDAPALTRYAKLGLKIAGYAAAGWLALIVTLIFVYRFVNPPMSSLMLQQTLAGESLTQTWVAIENISPQIVRAVLLSEDGRFCQHSGVDFDAMQDAIERAGDGSPRGASTISMQVTKNLFLWPSKSYIRKAIEIPLTWAVELVWPKRRIMEVYLNIAEWGPGIFGVEAASRFHFQKAASRLNEREAAQLAVALPNPYIRDAGDPGPKTRRLASDIQDRMRNAYPSQTACVLLRAQKAP